MEELEEVIERLLSGLRDRDTVVRWSAAKGVGRVTGALPRELGDDVVASVMELFKPTGERSTAIWWLRCGCVAVASAGCVKRSERLAGWWLCHCGLRHAGARKERSELPLDRQQVFGWVRGQQHG